MTKTDRVIRPKVSPGYRWGSLLVESDTGERKSGIMSVIQRREKKKGDKSEGSYLPFKFTQAQYSTGK